MSVVEARGVARWYGPVLGLSRLDLDIDAGLTGLVGPNGAGKSTLIKLITGQVRPSMGDIRVFGERPFGNRRVLSRLGYCPTDDALYDGLTGRGFVEFVLRLHGMTRVRAAAAAAIALDRMDLTEYADRAIRGYSKGMRQRVKLAQCFAHEPELIIADEPLTGLDPLARRLVLGLFRELRDKGVHLIVSSHVLHEVEDLTDQVVLIHRGKLLGQGSVGGMRSLLRRHPRKLRIRARDARRLAISLLQSADVVSVRLDGDGQGLWVETTDLEVLSARLPGLVASLRPGLEALESPDASLEAVFDYMVT